MPEKNLDQEIIHLIPWRTIGLRKLKVFGLRYEKKLYLILLGESNELKLILICNRIKGIKWD